MKCQSLLYKHEYENVPCKNNAKYKVTGRAQGYYCGIHVKEFQAYEKAGLTIKVELLNQETKYKNIQAIHYNRSSHANENI